MTKVFLDSNILIYLYSTDEPQKKLLVEQLIDNHDHIFISTQVLFEFSRVMRKKFKFDYKDLEQALEEFSQSFTVITVTYELLQQALKIAPKYNYTFTDILVLTTARACDCTILFSEDMHNSHLIENHVRIINPFKK